MASHRRDRRHHVPAGRTLHLIDIENLVAGRHDCDEEALDMFDAYLDQIDVGADDHMVVACSHAAAPHVIWAWRTARLVFRSGPDGADLALLDEAKPDWVEDHYDRVVVASGDGIFAGLANELRARRIPVIVAIGDSGLSGDLARAACRVHRLEHRPWAAA